MGIKHSIKLVTISLLLGIMPLTPTIAEEDPNRDTFVGSYNEVFTEAYQQYGTLTGYKAFALAVDANKNWSYGLGHNYTNQNDANRRALFECNSRTKKYNVQSNCRLYAVEDKIIW